jgi:hypothetical protein
MAAIRDIFAENRTGESVPLNSGGDIGALFSGGHLAVRFPQRRRANARRSQTDDAAKSGPHFFVHAFYFYLKPYSPRTLRILQAGSATGACSGELLLPRAIWRMSAGSPSAFCSMVSNASSLFRSGLFLAAAISSPVSTTRKAKVRRSQIESSTNTD